MNPQALQVLPGGCRNLKELSDYIRLRIVECMEDNKSKEEILVHLFEKFSISYGYTNAVLGVLERRNPDTFRSYYAICENKRKILDLEQYAPTSTPVEDSAMASKRTAPRWSMDQNAKEQHKQRPPPPAYRFMGTAPYVQSNGAASSQVAQVAAANARDALILPVQPASPTTEIWKQMLNTLSQILSTLGQIKSDSGQIMSDSDQIKSNSDQMLKLMTGGHGCGPPGSAAQEQMRGDDEQAENTKDQNQQLLRKSRKYASLSTPVRDSVMASKISIPRWSMDQNAKEQQQNLSLLLQFLLTSNAAASSQVPQDAATVNSPECDALIFLPEQPVSPTTGLLKLMERNTERMKSKSDQMLKLMTDGDEFGPPRSAAESLKRQRVEQEQVRGDNEQAKNLQDQNQQPPNKKYPK